MNTLKITGMILAASFATAAFSQTMYIQSPNLASGADGGAFQSPGQQSADSFIPTISAQPIAINVWGSYDQQGTPFATGTTETFRVRLFSNSSGPGTTIFDQNLVGTRTQTGSIVNDFGRSDMLYRVNFNLSGAPVLSSGTTYWLAVAQLTNNAGWRWHTSATGPNSNSGISVGQGWATGSLGTRNDLAFSVEAVPEPATMTVLGLAALAALRRRKKA